MLYAKKYTMQILIAAMLAAGAAVVVLTSQEAMKNVCKKQCKSCGGSELYDITNFKSGEVYFIK